MALMPRWRSHAVNLALAALTLTAGAVLAELWARRVARARAARAEQGEGRLVTRHPLLGWAKRPGAEAWLVRPEYRVHLQVNEAGLRGPLVEGPPPPGQERVLLLGDSFTEGYTVEEGDTVRARLQALLAAGGRAAQVVNGGTRGYSTDQEYLFYREEGQLYQARVVVLLFYYNDLYGNASADNGKPAFTLEGGQLHLHAPAPASTERNDPAYRPDHLVAWRHSMALRLLSDRTARANPRLHDALAGLGLVEPSEHTAPPEMWPFGDRHPAEVADMWRVTSALLAALDREVTAHGAHLLVVYVPARFEVYDAAWATTRERWGMGAGWRQEAVEEDLDARCRALRVPLLDLRAALRAAAAGARVYLHVDDHWTAAGNAVAAREIARALPSAAGPPVHGRAPHPAA